VVPSFINLSTWYVDCAANVSSVTAQLVIEFDQLGVPRPVLLSQLVTQKVKHSASLVIPTVI